LQAVLDVYNMVYYTHACKSKNMRTNIEIDDELMAQALKLTGLPTKRVVVEEGLRLMVRLRKQARALKSLKGLGWERDLDEMRQDRPSRPS
jgi:Arc/MetJ family transcription regulator